MLIDLYLTYTYVLSQPSFRAT